MPFRYRHAVIKSYARSSSEDKNVWSPATKSADYTVPGAKDTLDFADVTLNASGYVSWPYAFQKVRATLQKKNGLKWDDIDSHTHNKSWNQGWSFGAFASGGTYRAIVDMLQDEDVVRRGITNEVVVEETFTVTFDAHGLSPFTVPAPIKVAKNAIANKPEIDAAYREQKGHLFYWSSDESGANQWDFDTTHINADVTLYAQWIELPALNPVWDVDTCRWTLDEKYYPLITNRVVSILTEQNFIITGAASDPNTSWFSTSDCFFAGRKYKFAVKLADSYDNMITDTSAVRTIAGEVTTLPLTNMSVTDASVAKITWDAPINVLYKLAGTLCEWNSGTSVWDVVQDIFDTSTQLNRTNIQFNVALDVEKYYRVQCQLLQGEYLIYAGEMFYGTNPATGVEETSHKSKVESRKIFRDGQLFIEREGRIYNAVGTEVK